MVSSPTRRSGVSDSCQSLRHIPFFEALGRMSDEDPNWRSVAPDWSCCDCSIRGSRRARQSSATTRGASAGRIEAIDAIDQRTPIRRVLLGVVDAMRSAHARGHARAHSAPHGLRTNARVRRQVASRGDVYETIIDHGDPSEDADLVVSAYIQLGSACATSATFGARATHMRKARGRAGDGDIIGVLRADRRSEGRDRAR